MASIGLRGPDSPLASSHVVTLYNPIQLAAISNYKLAQLTFAPPDLDSLRKTAVIKNMLEDVYSSTPPEWLQQMTRWQYFTPESLEEMTQEGLEEIFQQYAQTIEAFRPMKSTNPFDDFFDNNDMQDDDLWIAEDAHELPLPPTNIPVLLQEPTEQQQQQDKANSDESITSTIFSQPNATISNESMRSRTMLSDKPLPANPILANEAKRLSSRMSWKSDTGVVSGAISQNLANELMNLFDMNFAVDIKLNTAPKLPELPFKPKPKSQQRQSQDMLTSLLPEFEKIALKNSVTPQVRMIKNLPTRSSSLRHRQEFESAKVQPAPPPPAPESPKRKTILRLASLMTSKKHHKEKTKEQEPTFNYNKKLPSSPETNKLPESSSLSVSISSPRKTSTSTVESMTSMSSSWSSLSENGEVHVAMRVQKPLPAIPVEKRSKKKRSKRKSLQENELSKSKSFIKLSLKKNKIRRSASAKNLNQEETSTLETNFPYHTSADVNQYPEQHPSFVRKMASLMKPRNKPVEV